jgi:glycosyltransferase involved in cell wall biosynthesis
MKVFVQIPCLNESKTLPLVVAGIPHALPNAQIEILVIDDGSDDGTVEVARQLGVEHIVRHPFRRGLAAAFQTGIDTALGLGADVIVNTDGDNQYPQVAIPQLIAPIILGEADIVIADRQTATILHFSPLKRFLQAMGSWIVRLVSETTVPDATSGFRAYSREAALRLNLFTRYTYTLETIIQAGKKGLRIAHIPITTNPQTRPSRLLRNNWDYIRRSVATIVRLYAVYEPLKAFGWLSMPFFVIGLGLIGRYLIFYFTEQSSLGRYIQSVIIGGTALSIGVLIFLFGMLADLVAANRVLMEEILYRLKRAELPPADSARNID